MKNMNSTNGTFNHENLTKDNAFSYAEWSVSPHGIAQRGRGLYLDQIKNWLKYINRNQLFVMNFETLIVNTTDTMLRLSAFLNINYKGMNIIKILQILNVTAFYSISKLSWKH